MKRAGDGEPFIDKTMVLAYVDGLCTSAAAAAIVEGGSTPQVWRTCFMPSAG